MWLLKATTVVLVKTVWLALSLVNVAAAQTVNIRLTTSSGAGVTVTPGSQESVELRFTNLGPSDSPRVVAVSTYYPESLVSVTLVGPTPPCSLEFDSLSGPFGEAFYAAIVVVGPMPAGSTATCTVAFTSDTRTPRIFEFAFRAQGASPGVIESDPSDNTVIFPLILGPVRSVPALGGIALVLLALGLCVIARGNFRWD